MSGVRIPDEAPSALKSYDFRAFSLFGGNPEKKRDAIWRVCVRQYCAEIVEAGNRMELTAPELAKRNGVTEQLKAENQMEWVRQMNACKAQAGAIVKFELIYD